MHSNRTDKTELILWALLLLPLLWFAAALAQAAEQAHGLAEITALLSELMQNPATLHWCQNTPKFLLAVLVIYPLAVYCYKLDQADRVPVRNTALPIGEVCANSMQNTKTARIRCRTISSRRISDSAQTAMPTGTI